MANLAYWKTLTLRASLSRSRRTLNIKSPAAQIWPGILRNYLFRVSSSVERNDIVPVLRGCEWLLTPLHPVQNLSKPDIAL
jgi:hypothetical protein